jgi:hydroxyethylthiazole kinase-like uncharacterized protein yjeF
MYILSSKQISEADKATVVKNNISSIELMEHAATLCFKWLHSRLQGDGVKIHVFCGIGNNGGDGLVIARHLFEHGYNVHCYVVNFSDKRTEEFLYNYNLLKGIGVWPKVITHIDEFPELNYEDIVVDAIFGNGLSRKPTGFVKKLIQYLNSTNAFSLAIDFPSGLFNHKAVSDKESVLKAGHVLTFQTPKLPFLLPDNKDFLNTWEVLDIGLDLEFIERLKPTKYFITKNEILSIYKPRNKWSHKGTFGHSLLIGGSFGKIGAIALATKAALKIGSGLVSAYLPKCGYNILQTAIPEAMVEVDDDNELKYFNFKTKPTVIGIGPGMGTAEKTIKGFQAFLKENNKPLVLDADAINILSLQPDLLSYLPKDAVLTPHPKELERLLGGWKNDYEKLKKTTEFSKKYNCIIVLKGTYTVIIKNNQIYFNSTGNPALATGGSGDVLTGVITGLIAQGYKAIDAAIFGVYLHGRTADVAVSQMGHETFTASNIIDFLPDAFLDLFIEPSINNTDEEESDKK